MNRKPLSFHLRQNSSPGVRPAIGLLLALLLGGFFPVLRAADSGQDFYSRASAQTAGRDVKCGFAIAAGAATSRNPQLLREYRQWQQSVRLSDSVFTSPGGHFKIYYDVSGYNAIPDYDRDQDGFPDYLMFVARAFERAWATEVDTLGFNPPPDSAGGHRAVYPVYCQRLSLYGSTELDYEIPQLPGLNYVTHILINTTFDFVTYPGVTDPVVRDSLAIAATAAHEFNHALQTGYRLWPDDAGYGFADMWFIESSAVYMEEVVADQVNDYLQYLSSYFAQIDQPIDNTRTSGPIYGEVVLELMLGNLYGRDITRRVWEESPVMRATPAIEAVLNGFGSGWQQEVPRLAKWLYFTGDRAHPDYFEDAALFPEIPFQPLDPVKPVESTLVSDSLPRLSFRWYRSQPAGDQPLILLLSPVNGGVAGDLSALYADQVGGDVTTEPAAVPFDLTAPRSDLPLCLAVANGRMSGEQQTGYRVQVRPAQTAPGDRVLVYPQPLRLREATQNVHFANVPSGSVVYIFTAQGRAVVALPAGRNDIEPRTTVSWDLKNAAGQTVGSGVYLYRVAGGGDQITGKFLVVQ